MVLADSGNEQEAVYKILIIFFRHFLFNIMQQYTNSANARTHISILLRIYQPEHTIHPESDFPYPLAKWLTAREPLPPIYLTQAFIAAESGG